MEIKSFVHISEICSMWRGHHSARSSGWQDTPLLKERHTSVLQFCKLYNIIPKWFLLVLVS